MTQKQRAGVVVGVVVAILLGVVVYRQYSGDTGKKESAPTAGVGISQKKMSASETGKAVVVPVPETIDGIAGSIVSESSVDFSALDDEEAAALDDVNQDSDSVNNLGTSYDENNL